MRVLFVFVAAYIRRDLPSLLLGCSVATRHLPPLRQGNFAKFTVGGVAQFPNTGRGVNVVVLSTSGVVEDTKTSALMAVVRCSRSASKSEASVFWLFVVCFRRLQWKIVVLKQAAESDLGW